MSSDLSRLSCWVISDGAAGNLRQASALAEALGLSPRVIELHLQQPWGWLAPHLRWAARRGMVDRNGGPIAPPWPDIAIGCGRRAALLTRCLRNWSARRCFTVQILDPRIASAHFDVVVAPRHDRLTGSNVIETLGALNPIADNWLQQGRSRFASLGGFPQPRTAVLIGASNASVQLDDAWFKALLDLVDEQHAKAGGSFLVSTSRRTSTRRAEYLREQFSRWPGVFWAGPEDGENPYAGMLAWSDRIIVSADSVNMVSEACATGKPVCALSGQPIRGKLAAFHQALRANGYLASLQATAEPPQPALRELAAVAAGITATWRSRRFE